MAQSYGNYVPTTLANPTDSITGVTAVEQELGTSISGTGPQGPTVTPITLTINDNGTPTTVTIAPSTNLYDISASIQAQMVAGGDPLFTARYDSGLDQIILSSGTVGQPSSQLRVTGGTGQTLLKLGTAFGGTESYAGSEVITYYVTYLFVYPGLSFGAGSVVVKSSDMVSPTSLPQMEAIANERAAQLKAELRPGFTFNPPVVVTATDALNGPVNLGSPAAVPYAMLAYAAITGSTGAGSTVNGSLYITPTATTGITNFPPSTYTGVELGGSNTTAANAMSAANVVYSNVVAASSGYTTILPTLDGQVLTPGGYNAGAAHLASSGPATLTFNGAGMYTIYCSSTLTTGAGGVPTMALTGGATAANILWVMGSSATVNSGSAGVFQGKMIADASITVTSGGVINGAMVALNGALTLSATTTVNP
jgi:hypothetical protein